MVAIANGAEQFVEIVEVLGKARAERHAVAGRLKQIERLSVVAPRPTIIADHRAQVADLRDIAANPEAGLDAIPKLRRSSSA